MIISSVCVFKRKKAHFHKGCESYIRHNLDALGTNKMD